MKKIVLFIASAIFCLQNTIADENPVFQWASFFNSTGSETTTPANIKKNSANEIFVLGNFSSKNSGKTNYQYQWLSSIGTTEDVASPNGAPYTGTSSNSNLVLAKIAKDGKLQWQVTSSMGDVYTSGCASIPTNDGGVFLALKVRHTNKNENANNHLLSLKDSEGTVTNVEWTYPEIWAYQGVFVKIDSEGEVEWTKLIPVSTEGDVLDGFNFYDVTEDENGDLYLGGSYSMPITFGTKTLTPHNSGGDLFVVKLSPSGDYVWDFVTTGETASESVKSIAYDNGNLYLLGNLKGDGSQQIAIGGYFMTPSEKDDAFVAKISTTDASVVWAKHFIALPSADAKGGRLKVVSLEAAGNKVFAYGSFTGIFADASKNELLTNHSTQGNTLRGFIFSLDASSGNYGSSVEIVIPSGNIGEISYTATINDKIYAVGYDMQATTGVFLMTMDKQLENLSAPFYTIIASGSPTSIGATLVDNTLISLGRGRNNISFSESTQTKAITGFSGILSSYKVSGIPSSSSQIETAEDLFIYSETSGQITIVSNKNQIIDIYHVSGMLVRKISVAEGSPATIDLPQGLYIVNGKKVMVY